MEKARSRAVMPLTLAERKTVRETAEELLALPAFECRDRLAVWLASATAQEIAALAKEWKLRGTLENSPAEPLLYLRWAELDPKAMIAFERTVQNGSALKSYAAWAHVDPEAAFAAALKEKGSNEPASQVVASIGQSDPAKARALLAQYPNLRNKVALEGITEGMSRTDFKAAAEASMRGLGSEGMGMPVREWARAEPQEALAWARSITVPSRQLSALRRIFYEWESTHPELIGPVIQSLPPSKYRESFYENHAEFLARTDPDAAIAWALTAEAPGLQASSLIEAATAVASRDPARAEEILRRDDCRQALAKEGSTRSNAMEALARADPARAMALTESLPGKPEQGAVFGIWLSADFDAAARWLDSTAPELQPVECINAVVYRLTNGYRRDYDAALRRALAAPVQESADDDPRFTLLSAWFETDPAAAEKIMARPDIPENVREHVRSVLETRSRQHLLRSE